MIVRVISFGILLVGLTLVFVAGYIFTYDEPEIIGPADLIVILSGPGIRPEGVAGETAMRVSRGVELYKAGIAPVLILSGGEGKSRTGPHSERMRAFAAEQGVPNAGMRIETRSTSTLHNAWYTRQLEGVTGRERIVIVTHRYHLPRAWASFRWAGFRNIELVAADKGAPEVTQMVLLEGIKWPANAVRAGLASVALVFGVDEAKVLPWLG